MAKQAPDLEAEIASAVRTLRVRARGVWWTMRDLIEQNGGKYPGDLRFSDGASMKADELLGKLPGMSAEGLLSSLQQITRTVCAKPKRKGQRPVMLADVLDDGTYHLHHVARLTEVRANARARQGKRRVSGCEITPHKASQGVKYTPCHTQSHTLDPPMVSPPITPSSFPPDLHISARVCADGSPVTEAHRKAAYDAFDLWSRKFRDRPLDEFRGEHRAVADTLSAVAQDSPIVRVGEQVGRHLLVPEAVASCARNGKPFKGIQYACQIVKNTLDEWALKGVPGTSEPTSGPRRPANRPLAGARIFDPEATR